VLTGQKLSGARPLGTPLYHYTSVETFQKIYESKKLHATTAVKNPDRFAIQIVLFGSVGYIYTP